VNRLAWIEWWYMPFALVNGAALGLTPILFPLAVESHGAAQVGLVMAAYNLGALAAPFAGAIADRWHLHRPLAVASCIGSLAAIVPAAAIPLTFVLTPRSPGQNPSAKAHQLQDMGHAGEWAAGGPSRNHYRLSVHDLTRMFQLAAGPFGWFLLSWIPAYAGAALVFALYPVLFKQAFHLQPALSSLAFALIVFISLPLYPFAGRMGQRVGPQAALLTGLGIRLCVLVALAFLAFLATRHGISPIIPLVAFSGVVLGWAFLSVASPSLTAQLKPAAEGAAQGALNASSGLAGVLGSIVGGTIAGAFGYASALAVAAAFEALGVGIFVVAFMLRRRTTPHP
jgi:MFS family permease